MKKTKEKCERNEKGGQEKKISSKEKGTVEFLRKKKTKLIHLISNNNNNNDIYMK